jgi:hypothetical protein
MDVRGLEYQQKEMMTVASVLLISNVVRGPLLYHCARFKDVYSFRM